MKDNRAGNDISVRWTLRLKDTGDPLDLSEKNLKLYLKNKYGRKEVDGFSLERNVLVWTFYGKDQKQLGEYSLELVANEGDKGMITVDACNFVRLTDCICMAHDGKDTCRVETETIEIISDVELFGGGYNKSTLNEILNACCPPDFAEDFNNDFTIGL